MYLYSTPNVLTTLEARFLEEADRTATVKAKLLVQIGIRHSRLVMVVVVQCDTVKKEEPTAPLNPKHTTNKKCCIARYSRWMTISSKSRESLAILLIIVFVVFVLYKSSETPALSRSAQALFTALRSFTIICPPATCPLLSNGGWVALDLVVIATNNRFLAAIVIAHE